jgi:hypothetical protein
MDSITYLSVIQKVAKPIGNNKFSLALNLLGIYQIHHKTLSAMNLGEKKAIIQFVLLALIGSFLAL